MYLNGKLIFVSLLLLAAITTSVFGGRKNQNRVTVFNLNRHDYYTCLPLVARPGHTTLVPVRQIRIFGESQPGARHHIIPYLTLKTFYNLVVQEDPSSPLGEHMARRVIEIWTRFKNNEQAGSFLPGHENQFIITIGGQSNPSFNVDYRMQAAYIWMPGNIFYGPIPDNRKDDPMDNFDEAAEKIVGRDPFLILRRLNANIKHYINSPSERTIAIFDTIMIDLSTIYARKSPYEFKEDDWFVAATNRNGKKKFSIKIPTLINQNRRTRAIDMSEDYIKAIERKC